MAKATNGHSTPRSVVATVAIAAALGPPVSHRNEDNCRHAFITV